MRIVYSLIFTWAVILNSIEISSQFDTLPNGAHTNYESFYGGPYSPKRPHYPADSHTAARPHSSVRPHSPDRLQTPASIHAHADPQTPASPKTPASPRTPASTKTSLSSHTSRSSDTPRRSNASRSSHTSGSSQTPGNPQNSESSSVKIRTLARPRTSVAQPGIVLPYTFPHVKILVRYSDFDYREINPEDNYLVLANSEGETFGLFVGNTLRVFYGGRKKYRIALDMKSGKTRRLVAPEIKRFPGGVEYFIYKDRQP